MAAEHPTTEVPPHPMQPIIKTDSGVVRFKPNRIIKWLFDTGRLDLDVIAIHAARGQFTDEDQMQLAQLLGYSVDGYGDPSYASQESVQAADAIAQGTNKMAETPTARTLRGQEITIDLERRVAALERLMAEPVTQLGVLIGAKGCVCPVGAEKTCASIGCPRRAWSATSAG